MIVNMEPAPPSELPPPQQLPIISEETRSRLMEDLGLNDASGGKVESPDKLIESLTTDTFSDLMGSNRRIVEIIDEELTRTENFPTFVLSSTRTKGMAIVLRAFDIHSGYNLIPQFHNLREEDLTVVRILLQKSFPSKDSYLPILKRLLSLPKIPEQQIGLNEIIRKSGDQVRPYQENLLEGAATMYQILGHLWPKLFPQNQTPPPQSPPPATL